MLITVLLLGVLGARSRGTWRRAGNARPDQRQGAGARQTAADGRLLHLLLFGLAAPIVLGLYALYRAVAVQVRFAQRGSNFVAAVSHELKTPLTAIRVYGEMLRDDLVESDEKRHEYYGTISAETERLTRLTRCGPTWSAKAFSSTCTPRPVVRITLPVG